MIPTSYVRCGTLGHAWFDADSENAPSWGTPMAYRCDRCGTFRQDIVDKYGAVVSRRYVYPQGYSYEKGQRPDRSDFRLALLAERLAILPRQTQDEQKGVAKAGAVLKKARESARFPGGKGHLKAVG